MPVSLQQQRHHFESPEATSRNLQPADEQQRLSSDVRPQHSQTKANEGSGAQEDVQMRTPSATAAAHGGVGNAYRRERCWSDSFEGSNIDGMKGNLAFQNQQKYESWKMEQPPDSGLTYTPFKSGPISGPFDDHDKLLNGGDQNIYISSNQQHPMFAHNNSSASAWSNSLMFNKQPSEIAFPVKLNNNDAIKLPRKAPSEIGGRKLTEFPRAQLRASTNDILKNSMQNRADNASKVQPLLQQPQQQQMLDPNKLDASKQHPSENKTVQQNIPNGHVHFQAPFYNNGGAAPGYMMHPIDPMLMHMQPMNAAGGFYQTPPPNQIIMQHAINSSNKKAPLNMDFDHRKLIGPNELRPSANKHRSTELQPYQKRFQRVAIGHLMLGICLLAIGITRTVLASRWGFGIDITYGVYVLLTGAIGLAGATRNLICCLIAGCVMSCISCVLCILPFVAGLLVTVPDSFVQVPEGAFRRQHEPYGVDLALAGVCVLELLISITNATFGCMLLANPQQWATATNQQAVVAAAVAGDCYSTNEAPLEQFGGKQQQEK